MSDATPPTIAFFSGFSLPHVGGVETYTRRVARELVARGYRVIVVSANYDGGPDRLEVEGIEEVRLPVLPVAKSRYPIPLPGRGYRAAMAWLRRQGIDRVVVNTRFYVTSLVGARLGKRLGVPVSLIEHGSAPLTLDSKALDVGLDLVERILTRLVRPHVDAVYGVSAAAAAHVRERFGIEPAGVWFNSIDVAAEEDGAVSRDPGTTVTVSYVGRVIPQKGVASMLAAVRTVRPALAARGVELRCVVAGDGAQLAELRARYGDTAQFLGRISQTEVHELLARTDVFVYAPVVPEGLPSSVLEAGVARCAVIGSPQGGLREIIRDDETGLMVGPDEASLAAALTTLATDPALRRRLGDALRAEVLRTFATSRVVDRMERDLGLAPGETPATASRTRVLHLLGTDRVSGAENVIITIMEQFRDSAFDMTYCSPDGPIRRALEDRGLAFLPLSSLTPWGVHAVLREHAFDVVHAHDFKASVVAALSGVRGSIVSHIHSNPGFVKSWNPLSLAFRVASRAFSRVVFVSDEATRGTVFASAISDKVRVIHNVVDRDRVRALAAERDVPTADVVFLGRLTDLKQPQVVIRAVGQARAAEPGLTGRLVGDGDLRAMCEVEVAERGLADVVTMEGFQANPYPYVRAARVALMPSKFEGLPLSAIECLALDVPVLNSGAGGLSDLFRQHPEFICSSIEEYAQRIVELGDDERHQAYVAACRQIVEPFADLDRYREKIAELYSAP